MAEEMMLNRLKKALRGEVTVLDKALYLMVDMPPGISEIEKRAKQVTCPFCV